MNRKVIDAILIFLVIFAIGFMVYAYNFMQSNAKDCLSDPIAYMEKINEGAECNCWKGGASYKESFVTPPVITGNLNQSIPFNLSSLQS